MPVVIRTSTFLSPPFAPTITSSSFIGVRAQNGPAQLRDAAERAARLAAFLPFYVAGRPVRARGIIHQAQPSETPARVKALALDLDDFRLAALAYGAALFGSAILGLAVARGWLGADEAFEISRLDEAWQEDRWGVDEEAAERTARLRLEAATLQRWLRAVDS